ncbi:DNA repair protein RecN [Ruficoccus amylovorans]|uniref:DNA repair protein RecN n=1 Tax=Ruficoccus amylovorans TaxID=1804625 RepID=A0A842HB75_9BACT|nr:DNA repair protein RecN [Ruficoccus amylovorans]MBC2593389.1 DNA repair protein RecN [Ruficoccus amylovorans]
MLEELHIRDLALMDEAVLEFEPGYTAVTGETGAGKSVLLGALSLLAGNRADKTVIRQGQDACEVAATLHFARPERIDTMLEELGLPACEDGALVLRRVIHRQRAAKVQVNGALATLAALQELGGHWIDFHGPGEPQKLFKGRHQLAMLDAFAGLASELETYGEHYTAWQDLLRQAEELRTADRLDEDEQEFLSRQIARIDQVEASEESIAELERDFLRLDRAQELAELAGQLEAGLTGDEGVVTQLGAMQRAAHELAQLDEEAAGLSARMEAAIIELQDLGGEFSRLAGEVDIEPEAAELLQSRMAAWLEVKRKHGPTVAEVLAKREEMAGRLEAQSDVEGTLERLAAEAAVKEKTLRGLAAALTKKREAASTKLSAEVGKLLKRLGFKKAGFEIKVHALKELGPTGDSGCDYLFSANAGQELLPLNRIASSGETARVMLALKAVLARADHTPLLVFDEVDANVGGEIGAEVGRELAALAGEHQVLCVTHLPQVAAQGRQHYVVTKSQGDGETTVSIQPLHDDLPAREEELARMLGDRKSASAREHARSLLKPLA